MKAKMTRNEIKRNAEHVYRIGYCGAYDLLRFLDPVGYTAGVYGWNADVYRIGTTYIVTGYRPGIGDHVDYELLERYNEKARAICAEYAGYTETVQRLNELREAFINELNSKEWILTCSKDGVNIDHEEIIKSETEPDFWTCQHIAENNDCDFWTLQEA